ncbi:MAG TPA: ABC transporter substrate-binding protein [Oligoflexia bacterium]|nr:ABC transporter substrate-binding protein [Oligoflexia bacterium]HMR25463.1 ABC transporter substrate-binding protein [Oligoflexia bacterium]
MAIKLKIAFIIAAFISSVAIAKADVFECGLKIPVLKIYSEYNPYKSNDLELNRVAKQIHKSLVKFGPSGVIEPSVAKSWIVNYQNKTIQFKLDNSYTFSDKSEIKSIDVYNSFKVSALYGNNLIKFLDEYEKCKNISTCDSFNIISDNEFIITLKTKNFSSFFKLLATLQASITKYDNKMLLGVGDFILDKHDHNSLKLVRKGVKLTSEKECINFLLLKNEDIIKEFNKGNIDELRLSSVNESKIKKEFQKIEYIHPSVMLIELNLRNTFFNNIKNRKLFFNIINPEEFKSYVGGDFFPATGFSPKGVMGYKAKRHVNVLKSKKFISNKSVVFGFEKGAPQRYRDYILDKLKGYDLNVKVVSYDFNSLLKKMRENEIDFMFRSVSLQNYDESTIFSSFLSHSDANINGYKNYTYDDIYQKLLLAHTKKEKNDLVYRLVKHIENDIPAIPIYYPKRSIYYSKNVKLPNVTSLALRYWEFPYEEFNFGN